MPYNGSGTFIPSVSFVPNTEALAEDVEAAITDLAGGLSDALTRDGQAPATAPLSMGGYQVNEVAAGSAPGDAINFLQISSGAIASLKKLISGAAATARSLFFQTSTTTSGVTTNANRFELQLDAEAETGSNAGSNLLLQAYADDGVTPTPIALVNRATGVWNWLISPTFGGQTLASAVLPSGMVQAFAMGTPPAGWLAADGTSYRQKTYANLFAAIGTTYGVGTDTSGNTTFQVPDLRGVTVRGLDNGRGLDPAANRQLGSYQADCLQNHDHTFVQTFNGNGGGGGGPEVANNGANNQPTEGIVAPTQAPGAGTAPSIGVETRMKNVALFYCIKT